MTSLADMYAHGDGVEQDYKKAIDLYIMAIGHNSKVAESNLYIITNIWGLLISKNDQINIKEYIKECITKLENEIHQLDFEIRQLDLEMADIKYKPGGTEYYNVKNSFENRIKIN